MRWLRVWRKYKLNNWKIGEFIGINYAFKNEKFEFKMNEQETFRFALSDVVKEIKVLTI